VATFQFGDIAVTDEDGFGEFCLREVESLSGLADTFIDGHRLSITERDSLDKGIYQQDEG
jgi:hypothetical protein